MTENRKRRRSWIITPALSVERCERARHSGADCAVVDFEDSVPPARKQSARAAARKFFESAGATEPALGVRVNAPATSDGIRDLVAIGEYVRQPDMVVIPKVESPRDLEMVAGILDNDGYAPELYALVETPRGIEQISSIVRAERLSGVVFGAADYAAIVGCAMGWGPLLHARSALVNAAHAAGIIAIDSPFFDLQDTEGLKAEAEQAKMLGYWTKGAVHPRQLPIIEDAFSPSEEEIAAARAILAAGQESGDGITSVGGRMIGAPFFRAARSLAGPEGSTRGND